MDLEKMDFEKIKQEKNGELYVKSEKKKKKKYRWSYLKSKNTDTDVEEKKPWTLREKADDGMNWKLGTDTYWHQIDT